jgi:hypothetical protein
VEVNHAVAEMAFVPQFERQADIVGEELFAAYHDGLDELVPPVDQPGLDRLSGKVFPLHEEANKCLRSSL